MPATAAPSVPTPGGPAYWRVQREAVALFRAWEEGRDDPDEALRVIRRIAAHGFARRLLAAHGRDADRLLAFCEQDIAAVEAERDACREECRPHPDEPPSGSDWCPRGCQPLCHMGECGMCGYEGRGVRADAANTVAEYCCHCNARTYQSRDGICERCGRDAETPDGDGPPASLPACAGAGVACGLLSYLTGARGPGATPAWAADGRPRVRLWQGPFRSPVEAVA